MCVHIPHTHTHTHTHTIPARNEYLPRNECANARTSPMNWGLGKSIHREWNDGDTVMDYIKDITKLETKSRTNLSF